MEYLEAHKLSRNYFGEHSDMEIVDLRFYLKGKPDTPEWRESFESAKRFGNMTFDTTPVAYGGRIFPRWALLDLYKLMGMRPGIENEILRGTITLEELPPLDVVAATFDANRAEE